MSEHDEQKSKDAAKHVLCPECEAVNPHDAVRCAECGFPILAHRDLARIFAVEEKAAKTEAAKKKTEGRKSERDGGADFFDHLFGLGR